MRVHYAFAGKGEFPMGIRVTLLASAIGSPCIARPAAAADLATDAKALGARTIPTRIQILTKIGELLERTIGH